MTLPYLTYIDIDLHYKTFDEFEIIITKIGSKLNVLRCFTLENAAFLDGHRWEQFILRYFVNKMKRLNSYVVFLKERRRTRGYSLSKRKRKEINRHV